VSSDEQAVSDITAIVAVKKWESLFEKRVVRKKFIFVVLMEPTGRHVRRGELEKSER
jgi:hypothetical protein